MKIYGKKSISRSKPQELREVTLAVNESEAKNLAAFFNKCSVEMKENPEWEHAHFNDFEGLNEMSGGLIVFSIRAPTTKGAEEIFPFV